MYIDRYKVLRIVTIIVIIVCVLFLAYDLLKVAMVEARYAQTTVTGRVSVNKSMKELKYKPTDNVVEHADAIFNNVKAEASSLNNSKKDDIKVLEIKNVHKLQDYYIEYKKYLIVKYKLINIVEDISRLSNATSGMNDVQLTQYFSTNKDSIEKIYGIADSNNFVKFAKTLDFFKNGKIESASVRNSSIVFDVESHTLRFSLAIFIDAKNYQEYQLTSKYYESSDNQISPLLTIDLMEQFD